jgi:hypothetical protein
VVVVFVETVLVFCHTSILFFSWVSEVSVVKTSQCYFGCALCRLVIFSVCTLHVNSMNYVHCIASLLLCWPCIYVSSDGLLALLHVGG